MSTVESLSRAREQDTAGPAADQGQDPYPAPRRRLRRRTEKRWEIGFFIRKIVNGWVAFYKQFPKSRLPAPIGYAPGGPPPAPPPSPPQAMAMRSSGAPADDEGGVDGGASAQGGPIMGGGDGGPIGGTSYEFGIVLRSATETSSDGDEEP